MLVSDRLFRSRDDRMLAGVAGGLAELWDVDPSIIRIVWALLTILTGGIALVVYIVMAVVVPEEEPAWPGAPGTTGGAPSPEAGPASTAGSASTTGVAQAAGPGPAAGLASAGAAGTEAEPTRAERRAARRAARRARRADGPNPATTVIALVLIGAGAFFLVRQWLPAIDLAWSWPVLLIAAGIVLLVAAFGRRTGGDDHGSGGSE